MGNHTENIVEEHYRRQRYFTISGVKQGVHESDIFAIKHSPNHGIEALHIEVQTSFRPVAYLSNKSARRRSDEEVACDMKVWLTKKFFSARKLALRELLWPGATWQLVFVHGEIKDRRELVAIEDNRIQLLHISNILEMSIAAVPTALEQRAAHFTTSSAGDVIEVLRFFRSNPSPGA